MISKNLQIHEKANPSPLKGSGAISDFEKSSYDSKPLKTTSFRLLRHQREHLDQLVDNGSFNSKSEAVRYCIQFTIDFDTFAQAFTKELTKLVIKK